MQARREAGAPDGDGRGRPAAHHRDTRALYALARTLNDADAVRRGPRAMAR